MKTKKPVPIHGYDYIPDYLSPEESADLFSRLKALHCYMVETGKRFVG
jgi:hypothetical protein